MIRTIPFEILVRGDGLEKILDAPKHIFIFSRTPPHTFYYIFWANAPHALYFFPERPPTHFYF